MFPTVKSGLSKKYTKVARLISFCWRNINWISPPMPVPGFSSFTMELSMGEVFVLSQIALLTRVKAESSPPSNGFPALAIEVLEAEEAKLQSETMKDSLQVLSAAFQTLKSKSKTSNKKRSQEEKEELSRKKGRMEAV